MSDQTPPSQQTKPHIVPRWEWRTFGVSFGAAEQLLGTLTPTDDVSSDELYLLSEHSENVKVRDDLMDIKVLREVDRRGLQRWEPVMKAAFPLDAAAVTTVLELLGEPVPPLPRPAYSLAELIAELVEPNPRLRALSVHKRRIRYRIDGCMSELSEFEVDGRQGRTLAVESEDPDAVIAAVSKLGLRDRVNVSVVRALEWVVGDERPRFAVIDVGTNSVKFHLAERTAEGTWQRVVDRAETTRLGDGMAATSEIAPDALERTTTAIAGMVDEARRLHALAIAAVGTAGLRAARNREAVVAAIEEATGLVVETISGEEESRLAYLAARADLPLPDAALVVFDTGGGSSQFTFGRGASVDERFSVDVGAVRYTERFGLGGAVSREVLDDALAAIASDLARLDDRPAPDVLVGMGGAITNITAVALGLDPYDPDAVHGTTLERSEIDRQIELYRSLDIDGRRAVVGLQPKRADVILAGACIVRTVMDKLRQQQLIVSDRGLRHGVLVERYGASAQP